MSNEIAAGNYKDLSPEVKLYVKESCDKVIQELENELEEESTELKANSKELEEKIHVFEKDVTAYENKLFEIKMFAQDKAEKARNQAIGVVGFVATILGIISLIGGIDFAYKTAVEKITENIIHRVDQEQLIKKAKVYLDASIKSIEESRNNIEKIEKEMLIIRDNYQQELHEIKNNLDKIKFHEKEIARLEEERKKLMGNNFAVGKPKAEKETRLLKDNIIYSDGQNTVLVPAFDDKGGVIIGDANSRGFLYFENKGNSIIRSLNHQQEPSSIVIDESDLVIEKNLTVKGKLLVNGIEIKPEFLPTLENNQDTPVARNTGL